MSLVAVCSCALSPLGWLAISLPLPPCPLPFSHPAALAAYVPAFLAGALVLCWLLMLSVAVLWGVSELSGRNLRARRPPQVGWVIQWIRPAHSLRPRPLAVALAGGQ